MLLPMVIEAQRRREAEGAGGSPGGSGGQRPSAVPAPAPALTSSARRRLSAIAPSAHPPEPAELFLFNRQPCRVTLPSPPPPASLRSGAGAAWKGPSSPLVPRSRRPSSLATRRRVPWVPAQHRLALAAPSCARSPPASSCGIAFLSGFGPGYPRHLLSYPKYVAMAGWLLAPALFGHPGEPRCICCLREGSPGWTQPD